MNLSEPRGKTVVLIPSLEPDNQFLVYIKSLQAYGLTNIVVVDDGSGEKYQPIFRCLGALGCTILKHKENKGKGTALKTGFHYIEQQIKDVVSIITADSDGQHAAKDVYRLAVEAGKHPGVLHLGVRDFSEGPVPRKSLVGNRITSKVFSMLYGRKLTDTQTGLRSFSPELLPMMLRINGSRFEYELQMLITCIHFGIQIHTVPIQLIYENGNKGTHFNAIFDSVRVLNVLFSNFVKFIFSSIASTMVDIGIAWLLLDLLRPFMVEHDYLRILLATVSARTISVTVNYLLNKNFVFKRENNHGTLCRYLVLCVFVILLSSTGVYLIHTTLFLNEKLAKLICDALLFLLSFQLQRRWVFTARRR